MILDDDCVVGRQKSQLLKRLDLIKSLSFWRMVETIKAQLAPNSFDISNSFQELSYGLGGANTLRTSYIHSADGRYLVSSWRIVIHKYARWIPFIPNLQFILSYSFPRPWRCLVERWAQEILDPNTL